MTQKRRRLTNKRQAWQKRWDHSRLFPFCRHGPADLGSGLAAEQAADPLPGIHELVQVDAGADAEAVQHVDDVLGGHVA
jgi:hypothetical protein